MTKLSMNKPAISRNANIALVHNENTTDVRSEIKKIYICGIGPMINLCTYNFT